MGKKKFGEGGTEASSSGDAGIGMEMGMGRAGTTVSMRDLLRALEVYTERHLRRMEELVDESYLIEYTLGCMDEVLGGDGQAVRDGMGEAGPEKDGIGDHMLEPKGMR